MDTILEIKRPFSDISTIKPHYLITSTNWNRRIIDALNPEFYLERINSYGELKYLITCRFNMMGTDKVIYSKQTIQKIAIVYALSSGAKIKFFNKTYKLYKIFKNQKSKKLLKDLNKLIAMVICPGYEDAVKQTALSPKLCELIHKTIQVDRVIGS